MPLKTITTLSNPININSNALSLLVLVLITLPILVCGDSAGSEVEGAQVRGDIIKVDSSSLLTLISIDVRDESGTDWHFIVRDYTGFTPSHLREHMVQALPITITYYNHDGDFIIDEIRD